MYCQTGAILGAVELLKMTTFSANALAASDQLSCELVAGHQGEHMAFAAAAQDGDQWWWLRWDGQRSGTGQLVQIDPCDAELPQAQYADDCVLPHGHPGPHSFDLPAAPVSAISPRMLRA
jgi:hypothetical protein